jgi:hypothetical protein
MLIFLNNCDSDMNSTGNQENFSKKVMRRVWFLYYSKKVLNPIVLESLGILVAVWSTKGMVSLGNIVKNLMKSEDVFVYTERAVLDTELTVQIAMLIVLVLSVLLFRRFFPYSVFSSFKKRRV